DPAAWQPRPLSGAEHPVPAPATGDTRGHSHLAPPGDRAAAARDPDAARHTWAARPHAERAAVLRRAGELFTAHAAELR
ncbi:aldehyde dehydrogenase family protein, partial [Streptomyces sp. DT18]